MKHFRKCWDEEKTAFVKSTKGMNRRDALQRFRELYPDTDITDVAFYNYRSRVGAAEPGHDHGSTKAKPLYSEQLKKGYIRIKVAQPSVWIQKGKWVYMETHPWEDFSERSNYIFLDGNTRNFNPENIERVPIKLMSVFCNMGGTVKGEPECTRINLARARLKIAQLDALEKCGQVVNYNGGRVDKKKLVEKQRRYRTENYEHIVAKRRERYYANREEYLRKQREYKAARRGQK